MTVPNVWPPPRPPRPTHETSIPSVLPGKEAGHLPAVRAHVSQSETWTIQRLLNWTVEYLTRKGSETGRLDAELLLARALACDRVSLYTRFDDVVNGPTLDAFRALVQRRAAGEPVAYLMGTKEFYSLSFAVSPSVMIPRPETEFVVVEFLEQAKGREAPNVVDLGTGSGAIAVTVSMHRPDAKVWAVDRSAEALEIATENARQHDVADRVTFCQGDLFDPLPDELKGQVPFVLSNPPYIPSGEIDALPPGVKDYEPHAALDGGPDGLDVVRRIVTDSPAWLVEGGQVILEIGAPQESAVKALFEQAGGWQPAPTVRDYAGHPRVVRAARCDT